MYFNKTETNLTSNNKYQLDGFWGVFGLLDLLSNSACLIYIIFKLQLNNHIKRILVMDAVTKIIVGSAGIAGFSTIYFGGLRNTVSCLCLTLSVPIIYSASTAFTASIAVFR